ncbi:anti-sigma factor family protein [Streptomyces caeni]|uniref:Anti-sigma factor family protein n=1 Tax=Streptomyces caeni TaxID=2307231 RepID=A0ABW4IL21_9ACTN
MTSTTDAAGHPEVEELSDLSEGLLPPSRTTDVRRHLDGCVLCADVYESLEEIRGLLGTLPGPSRMPGDVAGRIEAALAAEALLDATAPLDVPSSESSVAHVSRETSLSSPTGRSPGHARAGTGPGRGKRGRRSVRRTVTLGIVFTAAALGLGTLLVQTLSDDPGKASQTAAQQQTDAAHTYSEGTLQSQVATLLATGTSRGRTDSAKPWGVASDDGTRSSTGMEPNKTLEGTTISVPRCIEQSLSNTTVLAVDEGVYHGTAVYLVVTPDASDPTKVTARIVDAACVKHATSPGKVLLTRSYARS